MVIYRNHSASLVHSLSRAFKKSTSQNQRSIVLKSPHTRAKMKLQVALLLVSLALASAKFEVRNHDDALKAHRECREENNVPDEIYEQFLEYVFPEHKRTNCYIKCWVEKIGIFTEKKGFNEVSIVSQFTHNHPEFLSSVRHGLEKCIDHNEWESDVCTWTHRVFSCWLKINRHAVRKILGDNKDD